MRLVSFQDNDCTRIGVLDIAQANIADLSVLAPGLPREMTAFIRLGESGLVQAKHAVDTHTHRIPLDRVRILAPIPNPVRNILCVGKNYREHAEELHPHGLSGGDSHEVIPSAPIFFTKATTTVIGPAEKIPASLDYTGSTDYEGELGVIIGDGGRGISYGDAMRHVYGYTIINDVTSRKLQKHHQQWFLGKSIDGFCPMGPVLLTADEVPDVGQLWLQTRVNGEIRQNACVSSLIFDIPTLIETVSKGMTLVSGDIIATGTPAGVGMGFNPPRYLANGDVVSIKIDPIGILENLVD